MLLGPVFRYELYSIARRARYFWLRGFFGLALLAVMWSCYSTVAYRGGQLSIDQAASLADSFFMSFAWLGLCAVLVIAPALSAGVIATERERRTIEYLFATDLRNSEIVLSKMVARLLLLGLLLITALPILAIFRLMGGISGEKLLACFLILAGTGVLVTAASIAISVWSPRGRDALGRVYLVLVAVLIVPLIAYILLRSGFSGRGWIGEFVSKLLEWTLAINPLWNMSAMSMSFGFDMQLMWRMLIAQAVVTVALVALAVSAVRRVHLRSVSGGEGTLTRRRITKLTLPRWRRPLGNRPMLWKEIFARTAATKLGVLGRAAAALAIGGLLWALASAYLQALTNNYGINFFKEIATGIGATIGSGMLLLCGARAASLVTYEKERDTWLSIISTPLSGLEILTGKTLGNLYAFRWLAAVLFLVWGLAATLEPEFLVAIPLLLGTLLLLAVFSTLVGLSYSLRLSSSLRAASATMATLFFVGGGYILCCCMPFMFAGPSNETEYFAFASCAPLLLMAPVELTNRNIDSEMVSNYFFGVIWYLILNTVLWISLVRGFDQWSGRVAGGLVVSDPALPLKDSE